MAILIGDLNAKTGSDNSGYEEVMGRQWLGKMNKNGEILADLCAFNNTIIGRSVITHRRIHVTTRVGITGSQNRKSNQPYLHRRNVRKFNAGCDSTEGGGCCFEQPSGVGQNEDEANEERGQEGRATEHCTKWTS